MESAIQRVPVSTLAIYASLYLRQAAEGGQGVVITLHGEDRAVLLPIEVYQELVSRSGRWAQLEMGLGGE